MTVLNSDYRSDHYSRSHRVIEPSFITCTTIQTVRTSILLYLPIQNRFFLGVVFPRFRHQWRQCAPPCNKLPFFDVSTTPAIVTDQYFTGREMTTHLPLWNQMPPALCTELFCLIALGLSGSFFHQKIYTQLLPRQRRSLLRFTHGRSLGQLARWDSSPTAEGLWIRMAGQSPNR